MGAAISSEVWLIESKRPGIQPIGTGYELWRVKLMEVFGEEVSFTYHRPVRYRSREISIEEILEQLRWEAFLYKAYPNFDDYVKARRYRRNNIGNAKTDYEYSRFCYGLVTYVFNLTIENDSPGDSGPATSCS